MPKLYRSIKPMFQTNQWRIFPDDVVQVISGPEAGITGKVLTVIKDKKRPEVIVEGINMRKRRIQTGVEKDEFFVVSMEAPVHYASVMLVDPGSKKPVRTIFRYLPDGTKVRIGLGENSSQQVIPIPESKTDTSQIGLCGAKDTAEDEVRAVTYDPMAPFPFKQPRMRPSRLPYTPELLGPSEAEVAPARPRPPTTGPWASPPWMGMPLGMLKQSGEVGASASAGAIRRYGTSLSEGGLVHSTALKGWEMSRWHCKAAASPCCSSSPPVQSAENAD